MENSKGIMQEFQEIKDLADKLFIQADEFVKKQKEKLDFTKLDIQYPVYN